jgi:hypothetical protein
VVVRGVETEESVVTTDWERPDGATTVIAGGRVLSDGSCDAFALNRPFACEKNFVCAAWLA